MDEVYFQLVTDEIELEQNAELAQSRQFIFSVLSAISDLLVVCDAQGLIEETNIALCDLVGRSGQQLRGTSLYDLRADETNVASARAVMANDRWHQRTVIQVVEMKLKDGSLTVDSNAPPPDLRPAFMAH